MSASSSPAPASTIEHPHLQKLLADTDTLQQQTNALFETYSPHQLTWKPAPEVWNMVECLDHLVTTSVRYHPRIQTALMIAAKEEKRSTSAFKPTWFGKWFLSIIAPDSTRKVKTFKSFAPTQQDENLDVLDRFTDQLNVLSALIREADGLDLNKIKFSSPVSPLIRFTLGEGMTMLVLHQQRHLVQAQNLAGLPGFPAT